MGLLDEKVAVVTGAAQGIGFSIARTFVKEGARVVIADIDTDAARSRVEELGSTENVISAGCDVREASEVEDLVGAACTQFGSLDVMVNNAGITRDATLRTMTEQQFDEVIDVHLRGSWNGTRCAAAVMRQAKSGTIVNLSSLSGKVGLVGQTNYSAAKAGIVGLTKAAAKELAHHGVRVNAVQPGLIATEMTHAVPQEAWEQKMREIPMGRAGEPEEVANVVLFLACGLSSYMTGTVLEITGGRFM